MFSGAAPVNAVNAVLHRASKKEGAEIISVGRGQWALSNWFTNPNRFRKRLRDDDEQAAMADDEGEPGS